MLKQLEDTLRQQCRRLRRRERSEKRERVERTLHVSLGIEAWLPRDGDPPPPGKYRLVELRPGEVVLSRAELEKACAENGISNRAEEGLAKSLRLGAE